MTFDCPRCEDTGSMARSFYGQLDCVHCDVAGRRAALAEWIATQRDEPHVLAWRIHLRALAHADGDVEPVRRQVEDMMRSRAA